MYKLFRAILFLIVQITNNSIMDKEILGYSWNEMWYSNENKSATAMCKNMDEPHKYKAEHKKPITKG